ncbi:MAG: response regulator transcription factor [Herpetosiphonaceae bacterium]|nr:response regulator transcription factor [Herpetosiphonaceae bacterium]
MRILVIEDDIKLTRLIERVLRAEHYAVDVAHDGATGLELGLRGSYEVAVIDWMLPERDGPSVCRALRAAQVPTALLMLTARSQLEDRVLGLDSGADDYLAKPFAFEELLARLRALGRRFTPPGSAGGELRSGAVVLDVRAHVARRGSTVLDLTATEWSLLECLLRNADQTLSRQQLLDYVWSYDRDVQPSLVDVYISYLRKKLQNAGKRDPIQTVRGIGYRWASEYA